MTVPRTLAELKAARAAEGLHADEVGWADDPEARRDEGAILLALLPDGRCEVITQGRGESRTDVFDSEAAAVAHLARASLGRPVTHVPPEELAEARAATQRRAQETLAQMRAAREGRS